MRNYLQAVHAAHDAGRMLMGEFGKFHKITREIGSGDSRSGHDTTFDFESLRVILSRLRLFYRQDGIMAEGLHDVAEEFGLGLNDEGYYPGDSGIVWVIDPICGTIPFSRGMHEFCISIAAVNADPLELLAGIVYDPSQRELFYAQKGQGATLNGRPIEASEIASDAHFKDQGMISVEHKMLREEQHFVRLPGLLKKVGRMKSGASCGLDLAHVACGRLDAVLKAKQPLYDYAAGLLILNEAGGMATGFEGEPHAFELSYRKVTDLVASNGKVHSLILQEINPS
jgi:myo-inositol-1(or 4)-monophosphatase